MAPALIGRLIQFDPPLPFTHQELISRNFMGSIIKIIICYETAFWRTTSSDSSLAPLSGEVICDCSVGPVFQVFDDCYCQSGGDEVQQAALVAFINGEPSRRWSQPHITLSDRKEQVIKQLVRWFGPKAAEYTEYREKVWTQELYSKGCPIGVYGPGVLTSMVDTSSNSYTTIRTPHGSLFWAGTGENYSHMM